MQGIIPNRAMYKGLPTFRAGGVTSCIDTLRVDDGNGHKSALTPTYFSHNHFSSSLADAEGGLGSYFALRKFPVCVEGCS